MTTFAVILTFITLGLLGLVCWAFTTDLTEVKIVSLLFLIGFSVITTITYVETVKLNDLAKQQEMAIELGAVPLSQNEVYSTSQADLDKLMKIGDKYYHTNK